MAARRKNGKRRRRRGRGLLVLLLAVLSIAAYKVTGGFSSIGMPVRVPAENIRTDFSVDLDALAAKADGGDFQCPQSDIDSLQAAESRYPKYREKIEFFIEHMGSYDQTAVNTVLLSPEKIDFVLLAPFAEPAQTQTWDIDVKAGEIPYLVQYDSRWAFHPYGSSCAGNTACGPTCLSMAAIGLTGDTGYTPDYVSDYAENGGYYVPGSGTSWELFTGGAAGLGLTGEQISMDKSTMESCLKSGGVLIASMTPGDFTMSGHFIVIYGRGPGGFKIYDPSSTERSGRAWSFDSLSQQTAQIWCMTKT
jgi:hypothetical protein